MGRLMDIEDIDRDRDLFEQQTGSRAMWSRVEQFGLANDWPENPKLSGTN